MLGISPERDQQFSRQRHDADAAHGLTDSVRAQGVIQPVLVRRRHAGGFELIAGERRWRAARDAGLATVPALVRDVTPEMRPIVSRA